MKQVYFVGDGRGHVKIGVSSNPRARMASLQTGTALPLRLLYSLPGTEADEAWLHKRFADARVFGEWFSEDNYFLGHLVSYLQREEPSGDLREIIYEWAERGLYEDRLSLNILYSQNAWADSVQGR